MDDTRIDHGAMTETTAPSRPLDRVLTGPGVVLSRAVVYLVLALGVASMGWAALTRIDVIVGARGRTLVRDEAIRVTAPEAGLVVELGARIGDRVPAGGLLLRVDSFKYGSEADQIRADLAALLAEVQRDEEAAREIRASARHLQDEIASTTKAAAIVKGQLDAARTLHASGVVPAVEVQKQELAQTEMQIRLAQLEDEWNDRRNQASDRGRQAADGRSRAGVLAARVTQLNGFARRLTLLAPVAGTVTHLAVQHPGSVLGISEPAAVIAPDDTPLVVAIQIPNASMRRLRPGLPVRLTFDAYPYQDYGDLMGSLQRIDPDADREGYYRAWVTLPAEGLSGPRGAAALRAGLLLDAEIIVDRRSVLDFLLRPFRRLGEPIRIAE